ncbi:hypothetical protein, partial [Streptococcus pneumoniae]|uniref:hypothetical protein n=2 Tax=Streptococcus pneumoniae TaxID=1313 RepID=UPI001E53DE70
MLKMKHFFAGIGEINFVSYLLYICVGIAPFFHVYIIGSEMNFVKIVLSIPNFKLKLATQKKFTWRLVVQAFFRVVVNPIFD